MDIDFCVLSVYYGHSFLCTSWKLLIWYLGYCSEIDIAFSVLPENYGHCILGIARKFPGRTDKKTQNTSIKIASS